MHFTLYIYRFLIFTFKFFSLRTYIDEKKKKIRHQQQGRGRTHFHLSIRKYITLDFKLVKSSRKMEKGKRKKLVKSYN